MGDNLDALIQEVTVDAYGEDEQLWAFRQAFEDDGRFPFPALVVGTAVDVTAVDYEGDERRGLIALCWRDRKTHLISLLDIEPAGPLPLATARLLAAYRRWWGAEPLPVAAQEPRKQACEPPWDPWRLHRLERMMEPWQTQHSSQKRYPPELKERAARMVFETIEKTGERLGVVTRVARQLGVNPESLRQWVRQAEIDGGHRPGLTSEERQRIKELERENRELRRANEILKSAAAFFGAELDRRSTK